MGETVTVARMVTGLGSMEEVCIEEVKTSGSWEALVEGDGLREGISTGNDVGCKKSVLGIGKRVGIEGEKESEISPPKDWLLTT